MQEKKDVIKVEEGKKFFISRLSEPRIGSWHNEYTLSMTTSWYYALRVRGMITGCGLMQLYGFSNFSKITGADRENFLNAFVELKDKIRGDGAGAIVVTLGDTYYYKSYFDLLNNMGFVEVAEYTNYRHSEDSTQRLYICKL